MAGCGEGTTRALTTATEPAARRDIPRHEAETPRSRIAAARDSPALVERALGRAHDDLTRCPHYRRQVAPEGGGHAAPGAG